MILWSIQNAAVCNQLERNGTIRADGRRVCRYWKSAYKWIADQMGRKIGPPPKGVSYPVWSWYQWEGIRKRPDMRTHCRGYEKKGTPIVLITFEVPDSQVVLSDFDTWHYVLNDWLLASNVLDNSTEEERIDSWQNIFDLTESYLNPEDRWKARTVQATTWEIKEEWIRKIEQFRAKESVY